MKQKPFILYINKISKWNPLAVHRLYIKKYFASFKKEMYFEREKY